MLKITRANEKINIKSIKDFEKKYDIKLPKDYKDFLLEYNGGTPEERMYFYFNNRVFEYFSISEFSHISLMKYCLERLIKYPEEDYSNEIKNKILSFCITSSNCPLGIGVGKKNNGKIYIIDMEEATGTPFILISESFTKLMNSFEPFRDK